ncbi:hypothetical protein L1987_16772 [Smallanthus sonchifolius]|uniref:Uncharacterized protein n=1 Tax=Smallanthus sonchifolius TaxID=185202 RepID=A0ACB9IWL3_9ASTR|nr:hypothetical protein L1987_16772 [Smallanthus sonchifolius]
MKGLWSRFLIEGSMKQRVPNNLLAVSLKVFSTCDPIPMKFLGSNQSLCRIFCLYLEIDANKKSPFSYLTIYVFFV